jgi:hypothetical protein
MSKNIYVTTNPENGWDCVNGVYKSESKEIVLQHIADERGLSLKELEENDDIIIHQVFEIIEL